MWSIDLLAIALGYLLVGLAVFELWNGRDHDGYGPSIRAVVLCALAIILLQGLPYG